METGAKLASPCRGNKVDQVAEQFLCIRSIQVGGLIGVEELADDHAEGPIAFPGIAAVTIDAKGLSGGGIYEDAPF